MQFPVAQFTDVEDKLIANLTIKQFGILFGAGIIVFLGYTATKSVLVVIFLAFLFGVPALVVAFAKINGRPLYSTFPIVVKFYTKPKIFIFRKEATADSRLKKVKPLEAPVVVVKQSSEEKRNRLKELQYQLEQSVASKEALLNSEKSEPKKQLFRR